MNDRPVPGEPALRGRSRDPNRKDDMMENLVQRMRAAAVRRAAYNRTVREIESMSPETALDLGIFREDARRIARETVYG